MADTEDHRMSSLAARATIGCAAHRVAVPHIGQDDHLKQTAAGVTSKIVIPRATTGRSAVSCAVSK
jgi:hypothetical protein